MTFTRDNKPCYRVQPWVLATRTEILNLDACVSAEPGAHAHPRGNSDLNSPCFSAEGPDSFHCKLHSLLLATGSVFIDPQDLPQGLAKTLPGLNITSCTTRTLCGRNVLSRGRCCRPDLGPVPLQVNTAVLGWSNCREAARSRCSRSVPPGAAFACSPLAAQ